ncbi:odorant receptor Or2 isoform X2 [Aethina tumida]|uniref:odorant receptor Or2 isoform X2 n=1 Tax=Aethina tumida TaxID=116153 RepID=UPI0021497820|nr:odorant receptor Or2 isoform X2 [Aethina tumida]
MQKEINFLKLLKMFMMLSGIWRLPLKSKLFQSLYNNYSVCFQSYYYVFVVCMFIGVSIVWNYSVDVVLESLGILILSITVSFKIGVCQTETIKRLLRYILKKEDELKNSTDEESKRIYIEHQGMIFFITRVITVHTAIVGICHFLTKYLTYLELEKNQYPNVTMYRRKPLPYTMWLPFNSDEHYFGAFFLQSIAGFMGCTYTAVTVIFYLTGMIFICSQLSILQHKIKNLATSTHQSEVEVKKKLFTLIIDHQTIIEYSEQFNNDINVILLIDFTLNSIQVASIFFQLITIDLPIVMAFVLNYLALIVVQIFFFGWFANEIKEQSLGIADAIYEHTWYDQSISIRKSLLLMMVRAQKPFTLTIGPFGAMTNNTSVTIMKAAYSYVTLITGKKE